MTFQFTEQNITRNDVFDIMDSQNGEFVDPIFIWDGIISKLTQTTEEVDPSTEYMMWFISKEISSHGDDVFMVNMLQSCAYFIALTFLMKCNSSVGADEVRKIMSEKWTTAMDSIENESIARHAS